MFGHIRKNLVMGTFLIVTKVMLQFYNSKVYKNNMLKEPKDYIIDYNLCDGFSMAAKTQQKIEGLLKKKGRSFTKNSRSLSQALEVMETLITDYDQNLALIVNYAETILPMESLNYMGEEEKRKTKRGGSRRADQSV